MSRSKRDFVQFLVDSGALKFGDFVLKSGDRSPFFINLGNVDTGKKLHLLGEFLADAMEQYFPDADTLFGPAYKGISMATAAAAEMARRGIDSGVFHDRKEAKDHGEGGNFIGVAPTPQSRIVIIDDVMSSGGTKLQAIEAIEKVFHVRPVGVLVTVDRTRKDADIDKKAMNLQAIITLKDIADFLQDKGDERYITVLKFYGEEV